MNFLGKVFVFVILCQSQINDCNAKLIIPRVLLPAFKDLMVNFTLGTTGEGCYRWSTSRPDLIHVRELYTPGNETCSSKARIMVLSRELIQKTTEVLAEDINTGDTERADVIIDVISSLKIVTKSRELYMEKPPEMFEVRAYDDRGNEFTTLEGVEFQWRVTPTYNDSVPAVIGLTPFRNSRYGLPSSIAPFEKIGKHGHITLVEGINTGSAEVVVQLPHPEYKSVKPDIVELLVVPNLKLEPSSVYILPGTTVDFRLFQVRKGKTLEIKLSNKQFTLASADDEIAVVKDRTVRGLTLGKVEIMVIDTFMPERSTIKLPSALVAVIEPHHITLTILPFNTWTLTVGQEATIVPEVFGINYEKIWISSKKAFINTVPEDIFTLDSEGENGTFSGTGYKCGQGRVVSKLRDPNYRHLTGAQTLDVYPKLMISPDVLVLPWAPEYTSRLSDFSLQASGGDNNYIWASEDSSVVEVSQSGSIIFKGPGSTTVTVFMKKNKNSKASAYIHLIPPEKLAIHSNFTEAVVGEDIFLHLSLYGTIRSDSLVESVLFSTCKFLNFQIFTDYPFKNLTDPINIKPREGACAVKKVTASAVGLGKVMITLDANNKKLYAETLVAAYNPLISLQPTRNEHIVLALGSSYDIVYSGGPQPLIGPIISNISFPATNFHAREVISIPELFVYRVTCLKIGTGSFQLRLVSKPFGFTGSEAIRNVSISCKIPKSFEIHSKSKTSCSEIFPQRFISHPLNKVRFDVKLYDDDRMLFKNATSILFKWSFNNETIARFDHDRSIKLEEKDHTNFKSAVTHYITADIFNTYGDVKAEGVMLGYDKNVVSKLRFDELQSFPSVLISFLLSVVQEPTMEPDFLSIFNHPNNIAQLKVKGGSGHFSFQPTSPVLSINYNYKTRAAEISPLSEGSGEIIVQDQCLPEISPTKIEFQVISIASLAISSASKIQEGQLTKVVVKILDKDEKPLPIPSMNFSKLGLKMEVNNPSIADFEIDTPDKIHVEYSKGLIELYLKGKKQGEVMIRATWMGISSNPVNVQVFPRLKITPRSITLVVGSEMQLEVTGGPSFDAYTHFVVKEPSIMSISPNSIVKGIKPGDTHVTAMSMGYQGEVYSKDVIEVHVIPLNGIHIVAPTTKLGLGNSMPVYASGIPKEVSPLLLGSITPPLQFKWQVSVPNVVEIRDTLFNTKIQVADENKLSIRIFALSPGRTTLELLVSGRNPDRIDFNSSIEIQVFSDLKWTKPNIQITEILMAPNTGYHLKTNSIDKEFKTIHSTDVWNTNGGKPLLNVFPDGHIISGSNAGSAVIAAKTYGLDYTIREISLTVQVKPVHYLMINIATAFETTEEVKSLPCGLYLNITISYHDQYGYEFFVPPCTKPVVHCNICSKVHIEHAGSNHSIIASLASTGNIILRIRDVVKETEMEDYIKIPVDNYIVPNRVHLTVGEIVCYWTPLVSQNGIWSSDNNILQISKDGLAFAERTGSTFVKYSLSYPEPVMVASLSVEILPLQSFLIGPVAQKSITNVVGLNYTMPVFLINEKQRKEPTYSKHCSNTNLNTIAIPFSCELYYTSVAKLYPVDRLFSVQAKFDATLGSYACVISPIKGATKETSTIETNLTLSVTNHKSLYETFFLNFYPQFHVNLDEILLARDTPFAYITVTGAANVLDDIFIEAVGRKIIALGKSYRETSQIYHFVVQNLLSEKETVSSNEDIYILISSRLTQQKEKIPVIYNLDYQQPYQFVLTNALMLVITELMWIIWSGLIFDNLIYSLVLYLSIIIGSYLFLNSINPDPDTDESENDLVAFSRSSIDSWKRVPQPRDTSQEYRRGRPLLASSSFLRSTRDSLPQGCINPSLRPTVNVSPESSFSTLFESAILQNPSVRVLSPNDELLYTILPSVSRTSLHSSDSRSSIDIDSPSSSPQAPRQQGSHNLNNQPWM